MGIKISMGINVGDWEIARPDLNPNHQLSITSLAHCYWVLRFLTAEIKKLKIIRPIPAARPKFPVGHQSCCYRIIQCIVDRMIQMHIRPDGGIKTFLLP